MLETRLFQQEYEELFEEKELSVVKYRLPLREDQILGVFPMKYSPEHKGEFEVAIDFAVSDPRFKVTEIFAPADGIVVAGVFSNTKWGDGEDDIKYLNWINIRTQDNEFVELAHISHIPGRILRVGERVVAGEVIANAGLNGRMTTTDGIVDAHVHMFVGRWISASAYKGLRINWKK